MRDMTVKGRIKPGGTRASVGGIAGRNNSTITSCYVATGEGGGSIITARYGFVGGVAGANNGSITGSGSGAGFR